jgi:hypothetical protein
MKSRLFIAACTIVILGWCALCFWAAYKLRMIVVVGGFR